MINVCEFKRNITCEGQRLRSSYFTFILCVQKNLLRQVNEKWTELKWDASSRWSFGPNSEWGSIKTTTAGNTHPTWASPLKIFDAQFQSFHMCIFRLEIWVKNLFWCLSEGLSNSIYKIFPWIDFQAWEYGLEKCFCDLSKLTLKYSNRIGNTSIITSD